MSYREEILSQFDRYSAGEMNADEKQAFELSLEKDEVCQKSFQDYQDLKIGLTEFAYDQMAAKLADWETEIASEKTGKVVPLKKWYLIAATISMVLIATISWWRMTSPESSEGLYAGYYEPYPDIITSRGSGDELLNEGLFSYESGAYEQATIYLKNYLVTDKENKEVLFYLGQAYLANDEPANALEIFKSLEQESEFSLKQANQWYLALTQLKLKNKESAKDILQLIIRNTNHAYREKSEILKEKLN